MRPAIEGLARLEPDADLHERLVSLEHGAMAYAHPTPRQRFGEQRIKRAMINNLRATESIAVRGGR